jgi:hypothetical protein
MNARWVLDTLWPELPQVDCTIVARWWPWDYYCVSTMRVWQDKLDPIYKSIKINSLHPQQYVTHIYKCDKKGRSDVNRFYYMKEYPDSKLARRGHKEVVDLLEKGMLKLINRGRPGNKQLTS